MKNLNEYNPQSVTWPGLILEEKLQEMKMGPKEFALRTDKPEKTIIAVFNGESSITAEMAVLFEQVTRIPASYWLNHQRAFDEFIARKKLGAKVKDAIPWAKKFPLTEMIRGGWLPDVSGIRERTIRLLEFFAFSTQHAWEEYYINQQLKVAFRISLKRVPEPYALTAWLRKGELQAAEMNSKIYLRQHFKAALPQIRSLLITPRTDFFEQLQKTCLDTGVKVVHTPRLSKVAISGSTRWLNDTPLIQLSGPIKQNRTFAFTFFHEAGHILLHGKKDIFLEHIDYADKDAAKEREADAFAEKWLEN